MHPRGRVERETERGISFHSLPYTFLSYYEMVV